MKNEIEKKAEENTRQKQEDILLQRVLVAAKMREQAQREHEKKNAKQATFINPKEQEKKEVDENLEERALKARATEQLQSMISLYDLANTSMYQTLRDIGERATYGRLTREDEQRVAFYNEQLANRDTSYIQNLEVKSVIERAEDMLERINQYRKGETEKDMKRTMTNL